MELASPINSDQRDCYQEISNVAMGQAADRLAQLLSAYIILPIPRINVIAPCDLHMALSMADTTESATAVCQGFIGAGIAGEALLIFNDTSFIDLAKLMKFNGELTPRSELELIMDVSSVLIGACIQGIGNQIDIKFNQGHPVVMGQHCDISSLISSDSSSWQQSLSVEINYKIENMDIDCELLLLFTEDSIDKLNNRINYLLD